MKKKHSLSNALEWFKDVGLKVFAVLALLAGGFYVYAISWPVAQPNATSGVVGTFVGESEYTAPSNGTFNAASDYLGVNKFCSQEGLASPNLTLAGSHICTPDEMMNSYNHGTVDVSPVYTYSASKMLWINNGPPGYTANANDCNGWKSTTVGTDPESPNFGAVWNFTSTAKAGGLTPCKIGKKFACCK